MSVLSYCVGTSSHRNTGLSVLLSFFCSDITFFLPSRYLEWAVLPDWSWPASRMEEDHRHGRYLLLAHSYRHHPMGAAVQPPTSPWTNWEPSPGWSQGVTSTETLAGLPQPLTHSWPWGERHRNKRLKLAFCPFLEFVCLQMQFLCKK